MKMQQPFKYRQMLQRNDDLRRAFHRILKRSQTGEIRIIILYTINTV